MNVVRYLDLISFIGKYDNSNMKVIVIPKNICFWRTLKYNSIHEILWNIDMVCVAQINDAIWNI